ncbi:MAG: hypothetical protein ACREXS_11535, partial [Gammaproteobacteria bacterium]
RPRSVLREGEWCGYSPGSEAVSSLTLRVGGNQGDPAVGTQGGVHPRTSVKARKRAVAVGSRRHP